MEQKEKIKIRTDIAKFKVLYFVGVISASAFLIHDYNKIVAIFGQYEKISYMIAILIIFLVTYGVAGIIKNIVILTKIDEELK